MMDYHKELVCILDFGSQYTQLIARKVRELGVYCEIYPYNLEFDKLKALKPKGIILSGGPSSVTDIDAPICDTHIFSLGVPILGICYGVQLIAKLHEGEVQRSEKREYGRAHLFLDRNDLLFDGLADGEVIWMSHLPTRRTLLTLPSNRKMG
jgi:GMP synthase (glutamine-hydrolysing)